MVDTLISIDDVEAARIGIGVTGHRLERLDGVDLTALAGRLDEVMAAIEGAAPDARFRLVGSLAEGADTLAADAAIARQWQVDAVLPFAREDYAADFHDAGAARMHALLGVSGNVLELPGNRDAPGGAAAAYERAGRVVLAQSDVLLAVWDGDPARGRGGTTQILVEAVAQGIPVIAVDPASGKAELLWAGLNAHDFGPESIDTVARGGLDDLPKLLAMLTATAKPVTTWRAMRPRPMLAVAYPLLLAVAGVRSIRFADILTPRPPVRPASEVPTEYLEGRIDRFLHPRFDAADLAASRAAQLFRSAFVSNYALAALSVVLSLLGLIVPNPIKPFLVLGEFLTVARIVWVTRTGSRAGWHRLWLDRRQLAEQLRCLAVSARLGDLLLRGGPAPGEPANDEARRIARSIGLPSARVDSAYLGAVRAQLLALLEDQIGYVEREAGRMHQLEHRLHRLGGVLFTVTAAICAVVLTIEALGAIWPTRLGELAHNIPVAVTVVSASLPAIGAAIYGIRMQGDFAGIVERNRELAVQLAQLRRVAQDEAADFDSIRRLAARTAELLIADVAQWLRASRARPLSLPG